MWKNVFLVYRLHVSSEFARRGEKLGKEMVLYRGKMDVSSKRVTFGVQAVLQYCYRLPRPLLRVPMVTLSVSFRCSSLCNLQCDTSDKLVKYHFSREVESVDAFEDDNASSYMLIVNCHALQVAHLSLSKTQNNAYMWIINFLNVLY